MQDGTDRTSAAGESLLGSEIDWGSEPSPFESWALPSNGSGDQSFDLLLANSSGPRADPIEASRRSEVSFPGTEDVSFDLASGSSQAACGHVDTESVGELSEPARGSLEAQQHQPLDSAGFVSHLRAANLSLRDAEPKFFWEEGFWSDFFSPKVVPESVLPNFRDRRPDPFALPPQSTVKSVGPAPNKKAKVGFSNTFQKVVINRQVISWKDAREAAFETSIIKWVVLFGSWDCEKDPFLADLVGQGELVQRRIVADCLARKAPSTSLKRANSLIKLTKIATRASVRMPLEESELYNILHDAKAGGAPLSQLRGFMESCTFVRFVFGLDFLEVTCISKRCWGVTVARAAAPVRQAEPLRVSDVKKLHYVLMEDGDVWNRCFAGSALFCAYGRCRWSDMQHLDGLELDYSDLPGSPVAFVGGVIVVHKTMNLQGPLPRSLEIIAPAQGIIQGDWVSCWLAAREAVGCNWSSGHPVMPAPNHLGEPTVRALDSDEAGAWLRVLLSDRGELRTTSHSLKATFLSYCAKRGMSHLDRLALGGHSHGAKSADTYARDAMARPLRLLQGVIHEISQGIFSPDASRAGRLLQGHASSELGKELGHLEASQPVGPATTAGPLPRVPKNEVFSIMSSDLPSPSAAEASEQSREVQDQSDQASGASDEGSGSASDSVEGTTSSDSDSSSSSEDSGSAPRPARVLQLPTPPAPPTEDEFTAFARRVSGGEVPLGTAAQLRRLHFEAVTLVVAQLKQQATADPSEAVKKLPIAEKQARIEDQKRRLRGMVLEEEMEPSFSLIDACAHMVEQNHIVWLPPSKCTKRDQELRAGVKERSKFLVAAEQGVTLAAAPSSQSADCGTPLQMQWCLQRRGLALDMNQIISWEAHERWVAYLMQSLARDVPPGYAKVSVDQLLKADSELFLLISKEVRRVKVASDGTMEADIALNKLKHDIRVTMHLLPLRGGNKAVGVAQVADDGASHDEAAAAKKRRTLEKKRGLLAPVKTATMPAELRMCPYQTDHSGSLVMAITSVGTLEKVAKVLGKERKAAKGTLRSLIRHKTRRCRNPKSDASRVGEPATGCYSESFQKSGVDPVDAGLGGSGSTSEQVGSPMHFTFEPCTTLESNNDCPAETLARRILAAGECTDAQLLELMDLLPSERLARGSGLARSEKSFTTGVYGQGPLSGLRKHCTSHPATSKLLFSLAARLFPGLSFTTASLFFNVQTSLHSDSGNLVGSENGVAALSRFSGGHIKVHTDHGAILLDVATKPVTFDPTLDHETCDWTDGPRLVLVVYSVRGLEKLPAADLQLIRGLNPSLPVVGPGCKPCLDLKTTSAVAGDKGLVLQVFAGPARFAQTLQKSGFDVLAFDKSGTRAQFPVQPWDFRSSEDVDLLCGILSEQVDRITLLHLSPPFSLSGEDMVCLCQALRRLTDHALQLGLHISFENPARSGLWTSAQMAPVFSSRFRDVSFDLCMHGGHQNRRVRLSSTLDLFGPLAIQCSGSHKHASDAALHPSERGAYPWLLCHRLCDQLSQLSAGASTSASLYGPHSSLLRLALDRQGRRKRALVSEFRDYDAWSVAPELDADRSRILALYPKGARIVRRKLCKGADIKVCHVPSTSSPLPGSFLQDWRIGSGSVVSDGVQVCGAKASLLPDQTVEVAWIGIPREPLDFLSEASKAGHPKCFLDQDVPSLDLLVENLLGDVPCDESLDRLLEWETLSKRTKSVEDEARLSWPPHVQEVLKGKNTELLKQLLQEYDYPDVKVVDHMREGFRLSGWVFRTGVYPVEARPPATTMKRQLASARPRNLATLAKLRSQPLDDVTQRAWEETQAEVDRGWIFEVPCCAARCTARTAQSGGCTKDFSACLGIGGVLIARRFGLRQTDKVRVIDNCKSSGYNQTIGLPERFRLHGIEFLCALIVRAMKDARSLITPILGRTFDLTAAYKQYAVHSEDRAIMRIGARDTDTGAVRLYGVNSLPFGATGSVAGFLRTSAASWFLGCRALRLAWVNYFDDYPCLCKASAHAHVDRIVDRFFGLLGILYACEGRKAVPFAKTFKALGILVDLENFCSGEVTLKHTPERIASLSASLQSVLDSDCLSQPEADRLRGKLHWFASFLFGRRSCLALQVLSRRAKGLGSSTKLDPELREALVYLKDVALHAEPVKLTRQVGRTFLIFTDGSLEGSTAGLGGALFDSSGKALSYFSLNLPASSVEKLRSASKHPIYEIEMLAVWAALSAWSHLLSNSYTVMYLDNEAARGAFVACKSGTAAGARILNGCLDFEEASRLRIWFGRVPTHSNIADAPSRGDCAQLVSLGATRVQVSGPFPL
ncbi:unnamed protein product [Symbiodinium sp. CCMP2592]|nr:unnamed protein product [Symbiodinium sp. CCMP2592]